jgi:hypothetical protein
MNTGKLLSRRRVDRRAVGIITTLVAAYLAAGTAAAATWDVAADINGGTGTATIASGSPWSYLWNGPGCAGAAVPLPHNYVSNTLLRGWDGQQQPSGPLPVVVRANVPPAVIPGAITVPPAAVLMHPGPLGQCAVVRFTAPPGTNTYNFSGNFYSAYTNNPSKVTACGNGTQPKIVVNKTSPPVMPTLATTGSGNTVPIALSALSLSTGESVDFMVGANGTDFQCDSTILELRVQSSQMYPHGVIAVTPGPVNACAPYKLCFDVNVPNGPVGNGSANLSLQVVNNSVSPPVAISTQGQSTNVDGQICFQMPALAPGSTYDYIVTTNFTQSLPGIPPLTDQTVLQSPLQGPNNDLVCAGGAADCCPGYLANNKLISMFDNPAHNTPTDYLMSLNNSSPSYQAFINGVQAQLVLAKASLCGANATSIKVTFTMWNTNSTTAPTGIPAGYAGWTQYATSPRAPFTVTIPVVGPASGAGGFMVPVNQSYFVVVATATLVGSLGEKLNCPDVSSDCFKKQRFGDIHNPVPMLMKTTPGSANPEPASRRFAF